VQGIQCTRLTDDAALSQTVLALPPLSTAFRALVSLTTLDCVCCSRYVVLPPCLWGDASEGLAPPSWLPPNTPMFSVKRNRNTWTGHFGEMASWQMRGVNFPA
jgi:hypothetical protein